MEEKYQQPENELDDETLALMEEMKEDQTEDTFDDQQMMSREFAEGYPVPEPEETLNAHNFLNKAAFQAQDTVRTTWLSESELGRPLFNIRFLLDMEDISKYYLDAIIDKLYKEKKIDTKIDNKIANYFREKIRNITDSGMSNKGFAMNLNVTRKMEARRERIKNLEPIVGGKSK